MPRKSKEFTDLKEAVRAIREERTAMNEKKFPGYEPRSWGHLAALDHTYLWDLCNGKTEDMEYALDVMLAYNEAQSYINDRLDRLNDPTLTKRQRTTVLKELKTAAEEVKWLEERRASIEAKIEDHKQNRKNTKPSKSKK